LRRAGADLIRVARCASTVDALRWGGRLAVHAPEVARARSLRSADTAWRNGATFRTPRGRWVHLPGDHTAGAREMYCRDVYLRSGLTIPDAGWVVDLGANRGLFTVMAAMDGARVVAVEAQEGFAPLIHRLLRANGIGAGRVQVEIALAASASATVSVGGVVADDDRWRTASHAGGERPDRVTMPELIQRHGIGRIGLIKVDIEGSEFSLLHRDGDLAWLGLVDQISMEVHPAFGDVTDILQPLRRSGLAIRVADNVGSPVPAHSPRASYVYGRR
jgi:FkbM family methyltransferase